MKTSVVLTTYNGEKYLIEQLDSIKNQSREPDEVIIRDDCSTDSTKILVDTYIKENNLGNWYFVENKENEGWKLNFKNAMLIATGDIIFLCDQDDIWVDTKIEEMSSILEKQKYIELLVTKHYYLKGNSVRNTKLSNNIKRISFDGRFFHNQYPGCVYAFRRELLSEVINYWDSSLPHDQQLWLFARIRESIYVYEKPLIFYRRHENTETGRDKLTLESKLRNIEYESLGLKITTEYLIENNLFYGKKKEIINKAQRYVDGRNQLIKYGSKKVALKLLFYLSSYYSPKTYLGDLFIAF